jgi:uncharacterized protein (DUF697 family)
MNTSEPPKEIVGDWFWRFLSNVLQNYSRNINLEFFQRKYPGLPAEEVAKHRIKAASNWAGLIGFMSGAVISVASAAVILETVSTVASGFTASPVTLPALLITAPVGILTFLGEVTVLIRLQLHLAYDLFVLYGLPVNTEDPEQMEEIVKVAFGIKSTEVAGQAIQKMIPQLAPALLRKNMRKGLARKKFKEWIAHKLTWKFANKYFAEGALIRVIVPGIAIISAAGWDYLSTQAIGQVLQDRIRRRGLAAKRVDKLSLEGVENPKLILHAVLCLALTNDELSETEKIFYSKFVEKLRKIYGPESVTALGEISSLDWDELVTDLADVTNTQEKSVIYNALTEVAIVEGQLQSKKIKRLKSVANLYDLPFDLNKLKIHTAVFKEPQRSRNCLIIILMLFVLTIISCLGCSFVVWSTLLQQKMGAG